VKKIPWKTYGLWILLAEAVGGLSGWLTREGVKIYQESIMQPPLSPPAIVFPIVWGVLFALMGIGAARIYLSPASQARTRSLVLFFVQLALNFFWSIIFFNLQSFGFAFFWIVALWAMILWMILSFYEVDQLAAWLQVPYFLWVTFAAYLNYGVWMLNR
jgi:benzodiazapine receptor